MFEEFVLLTDDDVCMLIENSKTTSCCLDPVPTPLLKSCIELASYTGDYENYQDLASLELGVCPKDWKEAVVVPSLKKFGLDPLFTNLRPVSNLAYISKLAERSVFNQMHDHLVSSDLYPVLQSAYRRYHSTETALLKVRNDILMNKNSQRVTLLVLLDLSAAFDTVDHRTLLKRLTPCFGVRGKVLEYFSRIYQDAASVSCLTGLNQIVLMCASGFHKGVALVLFCLSCTFQSFLKLCKHTCPMLTVLLMIHNYICHSTLKTLTIKWMRWRDVSVT